MKSESGWSIKSKVGGDRTDWQLSLDENPGQLKLCKVYGSMGEEGGPSAHGGDLTQPSLDALGRYIIGSLLLFQCL